MPTDSRTAGALPASTRAYPWLVVALFLACYVFSYIDRQVLSLLVQPIKQSMGLSDTQIGLLQGFAFGVFYALAGVPIAWLIDSGKRTRVAWICVGLWSLATMGCGVVRSFAGLLAMRASTAIGEAGLPTAAMSIFSDLFERRKLARATGFFVLGPFIGGGLALLMGAAVLNHFKGVAHVEVPLLGALEAWRSVFLAVGAPGLVLAAGVALWVREPQRQAAVLPSGRADDVNQVLGIGLAARILAAEHSYFIVYTLGLTLAVFVSFWLAAWFPSQLIRQFDIAPAGVGAMLGPIFLGCGAVGTLIASTVATAGGPADPLRRIYLVSGVCLAGLLAGVLTSFAATGLGATLAGYGASIFFLSGVMCLGPIPAQLVLPNRMRAQGMALQALVFSLLAAGGAPLLVGAISDGFLGAAPMPVGRAIALVSLPATLGSLLLLWMSFRMLYRRRDALAAVQPG